MPDDLRIGIIGGTGLGEVLLADMAPDGVEEVSIDTPFGAPSGPIVTGRCGGADVALLSRHGLTWNEAKQAYERQGALEKTSFQTRVSSLGRSMTAPSFSSRRRSRRSPG